MSSHSIGLTILQRQYVLGCSRPQTEDYLHETLGVSVAGGAYSRSLAEGRRYVVEQLLKWELTAVEKDDGQTVVKNCEVMP